MMCVTPVCDHQVQSKEKWTQLNQVLDLTRLKDANLLCCIFLGFPSKKPIY